MRAADALSDAACSAALGEHRVLEVLLLLAEQSGVVLTPPGALNWSERVRRLVAQRPYDHWSADRVAQALSTTASTLNRRLALEGNTIAACVRETRLEAAWYYCNHPIDQSPPSPLMSATNPTANSPRLSAAASA